ncbi:COMPASS complex subunit Sdc1, putative [Paecilomyces variotii No. 5]|uniref:COMPASS complex subunit Sdc1, putative n=1 Tax=Byssochlamys spectabilis (strain No. 5 / NBRC 109023) TaxID=1356009 RepID=V5GCA2_BYSSN|nr:COMPASS complex subunit Sdc1, putative [Paecilomyces variotii No. 5]
MADDNNPIRQSIQPPSVADLHSSHDQPTLVGGGSSGELPREAPPTVMAAAAVAANSPMRNNSSNLYLIKSQQSQPPHTLSSSSSSLPQSSFLQAPQISIPIATTSHTLATMDGSAAPVQENKSVPEVTMSGAGAGAGAAGNTPAASSSSTAANAGTAQVRAGGAPARQFMNEKIAPYLLEGMKIVVKDQPSDPLRVLGEFLIQKSKEVEGNAAGNKSPE